MSIILTAKEFTGANAGLVAALPFWTAALGVVATWLGYKVVRRDFLKDFERLAAEKLVLPDPCKNLDMKVEQALPLEYRPSSLRQRFDRDTDTATAFAAGFILVFSGAVIFANAGRGLLLLTAFGVLLSFALFVFILTAEAATYTRLQVKGFSILSLVILVINVVFGAVAFAIES